SFRAAHHWLTGRVTSHRADACSFSACAALVKRPANNIKTRVSIFLMGRNTPRQPARLDQSAKLFAASIRCPRTVEQACNSIRTRRRHGSKEMPERLEGIRTGLFRQVRRQPRLSMITF